MGCYIAGETDRDSPRFFKAEYLCDEFNADVIEEPDDFPAPDGKVYVVVFENTTFDAAFVVLTPADFRQAKYERMGREWTWLLMDRATVRGMVSPQYQNESALR